MTERDEYSERFARFLRPFETVLIRLVLIVALMAAASQLLFLMEPVREVLVKATRWEGRPFQP